ncbi:MAG TPA: 50S ribosome-binding GTPase, partial [Candidatus Hydrogenedentes bacterium]|nr:50S ribosome-binding GTPase [Candidatus Hydrogenedentota bacterium]
MSGKWEPDTSQFYALSGEENSAADSIQTALADFEHYFNAFLKALDGQAELKDLLLDGTEEWRRLLSQKLLTQISEKACLIVVFAGGTNSGKSTLFNLTLQKKLSEVRSTAAATKAP